MPTSCQIGPDLIIKMRREDKVLESNSFVTTDVTEPVRIRMEGSLEDVKPMSLVTLVGDVENI